MGNLSKRGGMSDVQPNIRVTNNDVEEEEDEDTIQIPLVNVPSYVKPPSSSSKAGPFPPPFIPALNQRPGKDPYENTIHQA